MSILIAALIIRSKIPHVPVWSVMSFTAFISVTSGLVELEEIEDVLDIDVILFLIGMFSIVGLAESSGLLTAISYWFISVFRHVKMLIYGSSILFGLLASIALNDTIALMGPPIAYAISRACGIEPKMLFLLLAFSITIGSVTTPIGNPQNILIVEKSDIIAPFITFIHRLAIPTLVNLIITPYILMRFFKIKNKEVNLLLVPHEAIRNRKDAILAALGLGSAIMVFIVNDILELMGLPHITRRGFLPFVIAAGTYVFTSNPRKLLSNVDWGTIVFFMMMFITMEGVWRSGILTPILTTLVPSRDEGYINILRITISSILLSQLISNVPFTKLFVEYMKNIGYTSSDVNMWLALATTSTIAGNLTLLGAASNIIILEYLESRMGVTITFKEFLRYGSVITLVNTIMYIPFLI